MPDCFRSPTRPSPSPPAGALHWASPHPFPLTTPPPCPTIVSSSPSQPVSHSRLLPPWSLLARRNLGNSSFGHDFRQKRKPGSLACWGATSPRLLGALGAPCPHRLTTPEL